jgi:hypothetical protein
VKQLRRVLSVKWVPFWLLFVVSLGGYFQLYRWFPLRPNYNQSPTHDIRSLAPSLGEALAYAILLCALFALYLLTYLWIKRRKSELPFTLILLTTAAFCIPLLFSFPINATDVYRYFIRGRIASVYQQNPFTMPVAEIPEDPYLPLAGEWANETSPYGPLWEIAAGTVTSLVSNNLISGLILFKVLATFTHLAAASLIWLALSATDVRSRSAIALLCAGNPSLLLIFAMDGHNDGLMLLWLLLGWWFMVLGRRHLGLAVMLLAPLTKPIGLLPLPFFFLAEWRTIRGWSSKAQFILFSAITGLVFTTLAFLPFGSPLSLAIRLLSEAGSGGGFSSLALFILLTRAWGLNPSIQISTIVATVLFGILTLWLLWRTWLGRTPLRSSADIYFGYILQAFRFRIWYASWPFPWLLLDHGKSSHFNSRSRARLATGIAFLLTTQLSVLVFGQVRTELLRGSQVLAHLIGVIFTFLIPIAIGFVVYFYSVRLQAHQKEK